MRKLTPKQEKFARLYVELGNGSEAYRKSYSVKRMSPNAITCEVQKLLKDPRIAHVVQTLQQEATKEWEFSLKWLRAELEENHRISRELEKVSDSNKALELLAKMHGAFAPQRLEHSGPGGKPIEQRNETIQSEEDVENLTTPQLRALAREEEAG